MIIDTPFPRPKAVPQLKNHHSQLDPTKSCRLHSSPFLSIRNPHLTQPSNNLPNNRISTPHLCTNRTNHPINLYTSNPHHSRQCKDKQTSDIMIDV